MALMVGAPPPGTSTTAGSRYLVEGLVRDDREGVGGHGLDPLGHHHRPVLVVEALQDREVQRPTMSSSVIPG